MYPSYKNTTPLGNFPKPQLSELVGLSFPYSLLGVLSNLCKELYSYGLDGCEKDKDLLKKTNEKFDLNLNKEMVIKIRFDNAFDLLEVSNQEYNQMTLATQSGSIKNQTNVSKMEKSGSSNEE
jgi:hypothetical protein